MKGATDLVSIDQLDSIDKLSHRPGGVLIYKHSTRCFISSMALRRLDEVKDWPAPAYYLDLIRYRDVSNEIAKRYSVQHESPQLLWIVNGQCANHTSHEGVSMEAIETWMEHA